MCSVLFGLVEAGSWHGYQYAYMMGILVEAGSWHGYRYEYMVATLCRYVCSVSSVWFCSVGFVWFCSVRWRMPVVWSQLAARVVFLSASGLGDGGYAITLGLVGGDRPCRYAVDLNIRGK